MTSDSDSVEETNEDSVFDRPAFEGRDCPRCGSDSEDGELLCNYCNEQVGQQLAWEAENTLTISMHLSAIQLHDEPVSWWIKNSRGRSNRLVKMRPETEGVAV